MPTMTNTEALESLTGFDEIAIAKHFGAEFNVLGEQKPVALQRALIFVLKTRDGDKPQDAYRAAMELPLKQVQEYFADEDVMPDEPSTEPGKGSSGSARTTKNSPRSAS